MRRGLKVSVFSPASMCAHGVHATLCCVWGWRNIAEIVIEESNVQSCQQNRYNSVWISMRLHPSILMGVVALTNSVTLPPPPPLTVVEVRPHSISRPYMVELYSLSWSIAKQVFALQLICARL